MRVKLDECVDVRLARLFEDACHAVETVFSEKLAGASDNVVKNMLGRENIAKDFVRGDIWSVDQIPAFRQRDEKPENAEEKIKIKSLTPGISNP